MLLSSAQENKRLAKHVNNYKKPINKSKSNFSLVGAVIQDV